MENFISIFAVENIVLATAVIELIVVLIVLIRTLQSKSND